MSCTGLSRQPWDPSLCLAGWSGVGTATKEARKAVQEQHIFDTQWFALEGRGVVRKTRASKTKSPVHRKKLGKQEHGECGWSNRNNRTTRVFSVCSCRTPIASAASTCRICLAEGTSSCSCKETLWPRPGFSPTPSFHHSRDLSGVIGPT